MIAVNNTKLFTVAMEMQKMGSLPIFVTVQNITYWQ